MPSSAPPSASEAVAIDPAGAEPVPADPAAEADWADSDAGEGLGVAPPEFLVGIDPGDDSARVDVLQADPTTPYHSATSFEEIGLSPELLKGVYYMKFNKPSKIQATSLPMILSPDGDYKNLIAQAHNGSGKTACFALGMLSRIDFSKPVTQALCVVPTRELARQIQDVIHNLGKYTGVTTRLGVKDTEAERKAARSNRAGGAGVTDHIVVGTPGKVMDLIKKRQLDTSNISIFVLDEADEMVDTQGMGDQTIRIKRQLPKSVQVLLFSATYKDDVRDLASKLAPSANQIVVKRETLSLDKVKQYYIDAGSSGGRFDILADIYELLTLGQSIIFVRTRREGASLSTRLRQAGHTVSVLYGGDMTPEERDRVLDEFRGGTTRVLVTTNVLSRGVDVLSVTAVINYDLPTGATGVDADPETYLHRIGRTGRFGRKGIAINFVYDDASRRILHDLETYYEKPIQKVDDVEDLSERIQKM